MFVQSNEVLLLMQRHHCANVLNGLCCMLDRCMRHAVFRKSHRTFPPSSASDDDPFFLPPPSCCPWIMPVKIISGVKQSITSVSFQPVVKLTTRAVMRAPTALNIAVNVGPVKPFSDAASVESRVTKAPKLFSSKSNQPISCLSMLRKDIVLMRMVNSSPALAKVSDDSI